MNRFGKLTIKRLSVREPGHILLMFLLFLMGMNFQGKFFYWVFGAFFVWMFTCPSRARLDLSLIMLLILSSSLIIFDPSAAGSISGLLRPIGYVLCYVLGRGLFDSYKGEWSQAAVRAYILKIFWVLTFGLMAHVLLNFFLNLGSLNRNIIDVWTKSSLSATGQAALSCLPVAVTSAFLFVQEERRKKLLAAAILIFIFINNLMLAGRTLLLYILLCLTMGLGYFLFFADVPQNKKIRFLWVCTVLLILFFAAYQLDLFQIRTLLIESNLYIRYDRFFEGALLKDTRMDHKRLFLENMDLSLWGGNHIYKTYGNYAHDLYLDTYDYVGIFAFAGVCMYSIFSVMRMMRCVFNRKIDWQLRQIILSFYLVFHLEFWIEPILKGIPWFFALFCLIDGMIGSYLSIRHRLEESEHAD